MEPIFVNKLIKRIKKNWKNRKWLIYGAAFAYLLNLLWNLLN